MTTQSLAKPSIFSLRFTAITAAAALTVAIAATTSASLDWPVWAMFMGWVAFFTRGHAAREASLSYLCLAAGIVMGTGAVLSVGVLMPLLGPWSFDVVVFVVAIIVVSLRVAAPVNNIPAYFLGLITFFAAHLEPSLLALAELLPSAASVPSQHGLLIACEARWRELFIFSTVCPAFPFRRDPLRANKGVCTQLTTSDLVG